MVWFVIYFLITIFWLGPAIGFWRRPRFLLSDAPLPSPAPRLSVLIPFRNEADTIHETIERLRAQDYPALEVILLDDASTDGSGELARQACQGDGRFQILSVPPPPADWLGKCWALQHGAEMATGDYFLFTDAGAYFAPTLLRRAIATIIEQKWHHLVVAPTFVYRHWLERATLATFNVFFFVGIRAWKAHLPKSGARIGLGAFNLVSREAYRTIGGYAALRLEVLDDVGLGHLVSTHGFHQGYVYAGNDFRCVWGDGIRGIIQVLEKNAFPSLDYQYFYVPIFAALVLTLAWLPFIGFFLVDGWLLRAAVAASFITLFALHRLAAPNHPAWTFIFFPIGATFVEFAVFRSAYLCAKRGGIVWRDRFYPTRLLREGSIFRKNPLSQS